MMTVAASPLSVSLDAFRAPTDRKQYRVITLPNGLEALLIHRDPRRRVHGDGSDEEDADADDSECEPESEADVMRLSVSRTGYETDSDSDDDEQEEDGGDEDDDASHKGSDRHGDPAAKGSRHAAACLTVGVGSLADPPELRGLAHYLEHMLFMGSARYPDENAFEAFLSAHGGYSNGTTECESTRFLFEVGPRYLRDALDMFAQFFCAPLFKEEAMARELLAVESEFNRAMQNDYVRLQQVQCETSAPASQFDAFSWGNVESLQRVPAASGRNVRDAMLTFYETHYSAHRMKLCVSGEDPLDDMEAWVRTSFSDIPKRDGACDVRLSPPFGVAAGQDATLVRILPVRKMHALHLYWPMPPMLHCYRQKPWEYLSHAMGHEAPGSLSAILKERMWATEVSVGISEGDAYEFGSFGSLFEVNASLTQLGLAHWDDVVALIFEVVRFLRQEGLRPWIFNELRAASEMSFQFQEEPYPLSHCRRLAELMQDRRHVRREDLLRYDVMQGEFDPAATEALLAHMVPANTRVLLLSHSFAGAAMDQEAPWKSERWLGVKYATERVSAGLLDKWSCPTADETLTHPEPNPFMPEDFSVLPVDAIAMDGTDKPLELDPDAEPLLVFSTAMSKLWYKRDVKFRIPKTNANFLLCLPSLTRTVTNYMLAKIYLRVVHEALQHVQYQSYLANLTFELSVRDLDIEMTFSGFSDKLPTLIRAVTDALLHTEVDDATFTLVRDEMMKEYRNLNLKPAVKARYLRLQLLERMTFPVEDKICVLAKVTADDVREFKQSVLWHCEATICSLIHGNVTQDDAVALLLDFERAIETHTVRLPPLSPIRPRTTALPLTAHGVLLRDVSEHADETNSIVEVYYQFDHATYEDHAYAELLQQIMAEPLFNELRTRQQLGYEVFCMVRETHGVLGFSLSVQSASHAAGEIALRIDQFIQDQFYTELRQLPRAAFDKFAACIRRAKTRDDATLSEETDRYWEEIQSRRLEFRIDDHVVAALASCSPEGLVKRYERWLLTVHDEKHHDANNGDNRAQVRKLRVHVIGRSSKVVPLETLVPKTQAPLIIDNLRAYKAALACHHSHSYHSNSGHGHGYGHRRSHGHSRSSSRS